MQSVWTLVRYFSYSARWNDLAIPLRQARAFESVLAQIPIHIPDCESLAGDFGWNSLSPQQQAELEQRISTSNKAHTQNTPCNDQPSPTALMYDKLHCMGCYSLAHTCVNYERVIKQGLKGLLAQIRQQPPAASSEQKTYLQAMEIALEAVVAWAQRFADLAQQQASQTSNPAERQRLQTIADHCRHVPMHPARTFHEALQSIWLIHASIGLSELSDSSLSLGRLDQYLLELYKQSVKEHGIPAIEDALADLFAKLNRYGDPACTVNLGGLDNKGQDQFNDLSATIVRVAKRLRNPSPILAARIHSDIDPDVFDLLLDPQLAQIGQPTFYGELPCREAMLRRGVTGEQVHHWTANSCMGLVMPGQEVSNMWAAVVNMLLPLECTVNQGRLYSHEMPIPLSTQPLETFSSFEQLFDKLAEYMDELIHWGVSHCLYSTDLAANESPNPFLSALLDDCIARGLDRANGGARYHTAIVEAFGLVNVSDALLAIRELVFTQKRYTLEQLVAAAKDDFAGSPEILAAINSLPKYGNNHPDADAMARRLSDAFAASVTRHSDQRITFAPSFHTLTQHVHAGSKMKASLDGRRAHRPLAKNIGGTPGRSTKGHTALALSAAAIDQTSFSGGQALDLSFRADMLDNADYRHNFQALLQTYFRMGGLQVQINAVSPETLEAAIDRPSEHQDVIVRIAGYSTQFVQLPQDVQREMVQRFENGL